MSVGDGRRLRRAVKAVPFLGPRLRDAYARLEAAYWSAIRTPLRHRRLAAANRLKDFRNAHARSARNVTRRNTRRAYARLYSSDDLLADYLTPERLRFYDEIADSCITLHPKKIIDIGCGTGELLRRIVNRVPAVDVVGIDHAKSAVDRARNLVPSGRWYVADLYTFESERDFDLVICTEVLEHLQRPEHAVERLARLCAVGGRLAVTVPDGAIDDYEGHVNFWTESEFEAFMSRFGRASVTRVDRGNCLFALVSLP